MFNIKTVDDYLGMLVFNYGGNRLGQVVFPEGATSATFWRAGEQDTRHYNLMEYLIAEYEYIGTALTL